MARRYRHSSQPADGYRPVHHPERPVVAHEHAELLLAAACLVSAFITSTCEFHRSWGCKHGSTRNAIHHGLNTPSSSSRLKGVVVGSDHQWVVMPQ